MKKECLICGKEFETLPRGGNRKYCFECSPSSTGRAAAITFIRHSIKRELVRYKGDKCEICGYNNCIGALQFHHLDSSQKDFELSVKYNNGNFDMKSLYKEVDKCQLLCANCHAEKHFCY